MSEYTFLSLEDINKLKQESIEKKTYDKCIATYLHSIRKVIEDTLLYNPHTSHIIYLYPINRFDREKLEGAIEFLRTKGYVCRKNVDGWYIEFPQVTKVEIKIDPPHLEDLLKVIKTTCIQNVKSAIEKFNQQRK